MSQRAHGMSRFPPSKPSIGYRTIVIPEVPLATDRAAGTIQPEPKIQRLRSGLAEEDRPTRQLLEFSGGSKHGRWTKSGP